MALYLVATPIGNDQDISLRALERLKQSATIILEERKEGARFLRAHGLTGKTFENLNEHSTAEDLSRLLKLCKEQDVSLITDCGTPGFCDPGSRLVKECRAAGVSVRTLPGASSLMGILSLSSERIDEFLFRGFIPADNEFRQRELKKLELESRAVVLMDTPYRFRKMMGEMEKHFPQRRMLLAINLTQENELIFEGTAQEIQKKSLPDKAEFILLLYPAANKKS